MNEKIKVPKEIINEIEAKTKELKVYGEHKLVNTHIYNLKERTNNDGNIEELSIRFNSFDRINSWEKPLSDEDTLVIALDHNFEIMFDDNVIFIDHHLMETKHNVKYSSNGLMMYDNYAEICKEIYNILNKYYVKYVYILAHCDLDGLSSALIMKAILNGQTSKEEFKICKVLSEYGDIGDKPEKNLKGIIDDKDIEVYAKKIKSWSSNFGKFMKAVRPMLLETYNTAMTTIGMWTVDENNYKYENPIKITGQLDLIGKKYNINNLDILDFVNSSIYRPILNMESVNLRNVIVYMDSISQSYLFNNIVTMFNDEAQRLTNSFTSPDIVGTTEMLIRFKVKPEVLYKLLIVNSPFDLGRSIEWKYRTEIYKQCKNYSVSPWYFKFTDYLTQMDILKIAKNKEDYSIYNGNNIVCYNTMIGKLSMDGEYAFEICSEAFDGGGHCSDEMSNNNLGSAVVEDYNDFTSSFIVERIL